MTASHSLRRPALLLIGAISLLLTACQSPPRGKESWPLQLAKQVDLPRFMGTWYVIGSIGADFERGAYNARQIYKLEPDGTVDMTFTYHADDFNGPMKEYSSRGYVLDKTNNAIWGQQYVWPIKADYRISYLSPDYTQTVITREKRDYVWIMARTPGVSDADYQRLVAIARRQGYDTSLIRRVPQSGS